MRDPWAAQTERLSIDTPEGIWRAEIYEPFCFPKLELWLQDRADYKKVAKEDRARAKADYVKAENEAKAEIEKAKAKYHKDVVRNLLKKEDNLKKKARIEKAKKDVRATIEKTKMKIEAAKVMLDMIEMKKEEKEEEEEKKKEKKEEEEEDKTEWE